MNFKKAILLLTCQLFFIVLLFAHNTIVKYDNYNFANECFYIGNNKPFTYTWNNTGSIKSTLKNPLIIREVAYDTISKSKAIIPEPCPNPEKLDNICMNISNRTLDPKPKGDYVYMYQRKILDAACVDIEKDSEEVIAQKIQKMWDASTYRLTCQAITFDVNAGNLLKYAVSTKFDEFIDDAIWWKVNLNIVDKQDQRTVLDYVAYHINESKGKNIESKYRHYYDILRAAGAKHAAELKKK